jgi:hypothetical protein
MAPKTPQGFPGVKFDSAGWCTNRIIATNGEVLRFEFRAVFDRERCLNW